jgi:uncharacterized membrane protein
LVLCLVEGPSLAYLGGVKKSVWARFQASFWAGLVIVLPAVISVAVLKWLFGTLTDITNTLLIFLPAQWTHKNHGEGELYWYCSIVTLLLAVFLIALMGTLARYYFGRKIIEWVDSALMRTPLVNKIYGATKQVNEAFSASNKSAFRTVVLVEFPHAGTYSIGFITSERQQEVQAKTGHKVVCVFVPATPNPTSGFLLMVPEDKVTKLDMSVAEGIKYVISLGAIMPGYVSAPPVDAKILPGAVPSAVGHD